MTTLYGLGSSWMYPPIAAPIYGLPEVTGPRWLDGVDGTVGSPPTRVSLAYGSRPWPTRGRAWIALTTSLDPTGDDDLAWFGLLALMNMLAPSDPARHRTGGSPSAAHRQFWKNSMAYLGQRAARHNRWATCDWTIRDRPRTVRYTRFAGGWTAFVNDVGTAGLYAIAKGLPVRSLVVDVVTDGAPYHFDLTQPIAPGNHSRALALGPVDDLPEPHYPVLADHRRLL